MFQYKANWEKSIQRGSAVEIYVVSAACVTWILIALGSVLRQLAGLQPSSKLQQMPQLRRYRTKVRVTKGK